VARHDVSARVGEALHLEAWRRRITTTDLGRAMGVGQSTASKKLRGIVPITVDELDAVCRALDIDPVEVLLPREDSNLKPAGYRPRHLEAV
jgi:transcriptional regulator with XRE-family HTH domain